ncbi:MAG: Si-specific NAD(P)(+) transhydrogenase [Gemmatimonadaceae bacterium]|nr:Si-specific NAD(P)(+) transhydrogenase [Gemmatimonadaceae bacterium]
MDTDYDLVVIGSGPAGQRGAIAAAKLGKRVAIVDQRELVGGVCLHTGTIPSKTLREAILYLSGLRQRAFYGRDYSLKDQVTFADLTFRVQSVMARELEVIRSQLKRNNVALLGGRGAFAGPHCVEVSAPDGSVSRVRAANVLVACGTRPARPSAIPFDGERFIDSDQILSLPGLPREMIVIGGGVIGLEYAAMFSAAGTRVSIVDARHQLLEFVDRELVEMLCHVMRQQNATFRLGDSLEGVDVDARGRIVARLASQRVVRGDVLLYSAGRQTNADRLALDAVGLAADSRGRIAVDACYRTAVPHVYAAGDVIGFPALAATSSEQGRLAVSHMFGVAASAVETSLLPYGIYTIPEISMVGATEESLAAERVPYEVGQARFAELARAQMMGVDSGLLKVLFHREDRRVLGVHAIGDSATELLHIGQAAMALGGTIEYFRDAVFNYPTLAEAYKVAGLDGTNRL